MCGSGRSPARRNLSLQLWLTLLLFLLGGSLFGAPAYAIEPWADPDLPEREGLIAWFDAAREPAARRLEGMAQPARDGGELDRWHDGSGNRLSVSQPHKESRPRWVTSVGGDPVVRFTGHSFLYAEAKPRLSPEAATVFAVFAPASNTGTFDALLSWNRQGADDYRTGLNIDLGSKAADHWVGLNVEGAGQAGERNLLTEPMPLGAWHVLSVRSTPGPAGTALFVDGRPQGKRDRLAGAMAIDQLLVGARYNGTPPFAQQFLTGDVAEIIIYSRDLSDEQRRRVEAYLTAKYASHLKPVESASAANVVHEAPLEPVTYPPPVQMLMPGFEVRELPVSLTNANNVAFAPDGRLFVAGYDGRLHVLRDTDGDRLEDSVTTFDKEVSDDYPLGMTYAKKGLYVLRRHRLVLYVDTDGDGVPDKEETAASDWRDPQVDADPLYEHRRVDDALGLAVADDGTAYVSIGAANYGNAYLLDKQKQPHVDLSRRRGCVLRIRPGGKPEIFATGVRFVMSMQVNRQGDLFATDQEGATWMPNGNPFDELLHLREGRHYGFPPRHPTYLPNVIDEPSVFDYAPQHESTCGFRFNEARDGWAPFGPAGWEGDALVTGESRGKLFRTKLVKTPQGYVARNQLVACLGALPVDLAVSPRGELVVAAHSGQPDWGSGPSGKGRLFKIRYVGERSPQPILAWPAGADKTRVTFDRPLDAAERKALVNAPSDPTSVKIAGGRYATAGDRFESLRPGYAVVNDIQQVEPRYAVPVSSAAVSEDGRTFTLKHASRDAAMNYLLSIPWPSATMVTSPDVLRQQPVVELAHDLSGIEAEWTPATGDHTERWSGWLPHADLNVAAELTRGSAVHAPLWELLRRPGTLRLRGQLDLWQMLHPAVQPGSKLDYVPAVETVVLDWRASGGTVTLTVTGDAAKVDQISPGAARLTVVASQRWVPFEATLTTAARSESPPQLRIGWHTNEDSSERALPLRRFYVPWAKPLGNVTPDRRSAPELAGGNWQAGRAVFFDKNVACARCHTVRGEGGKVAPDLSNLIHRDYASVMKDVRQPSATINPDYLYYVVELTNRDTLSGIVAAASESEVRLGDASGTITSVPRSKVKSMRTSKISMMPEGLLDTLSPQQVKDLMTFLLTDPPAAEGR